MAATVDKRSAGNDVPLPDEVGQYIFDLSQCARSMSSSAEDVHSYYLMFKELSDRFYSKSEWPNNDSVARECNFDEKFLVFYRYVRASYSYLMQLCCAYYVIITVQGVKHAAHFFHFQACKDIFIRRVLGCV